MLENHLADLTLAEKRYLKEKLREPAPFANGRISLNTLGFSYEQDRGVVVVHGLIRGDAIDGRELLLPDFRALADEALADVVVYETEAEEAEAVRKHLLEELSEEDQQALRRRLPELQSGAEVVLPPLEFLYDAESDTVRIDVRVAGSRHETRDELFLPWAVFAGVGGEA